MIARAAQLGVAALLLTIAAGCGGDDGAAERQRTQADPFTEVSRQPSLTRTARRAAPRWEHLSTMQGAAPATKALQISPRAIQWRARWSCTTGRLALAVEPAPRSEPESSGGRCPGSGEANWVQTGAQRLRVEAQGRWRVIVEQQVDTPLHEPPLPQMRAAGAKVLASGDFYDIERQGSGRARLYRLPGGRTALRLDPFRTSSNTDLYVWLSEARRPRTTKQAARAPRVGRLIPLKSTIGEQNYVLPRSVDQRRIRSIVIWCAPIQIVYTVAALSR